MLKISFIYKKQMIIYEWEYMKMEYKEKIIKMIKKINNDSFLEMIYGFVKFLYERNAEV